MSNPPVTRTFQDKNFEIDADLFLGNDQFIFVNCIFKVAAGKKISFGSGSGSFTNCKFYSCDGAWSGLYINYNSTVNLVSCALEFAQTTVYASGNSSLSITNTNFYHNDLGLRIEGNVNVVRFSGNIIRGYPKYSLAHGYNVRYNGNSGQGMWINGNRLLVNLSSSKLSFNRFMQLE